MNLKVLANEMSDHRDFLEDKYLKLYYEKKCHSNILGMYKGLYDHFERTAHNCLHFDYYQKLKIMKKYTYKIQFNITGDAEVEAGNERQAKNKILKNVNLSNILLENYKEKIESLELIKTKEN